jgi:hypothetical protein
MRHARPADLDRVEGLLERLRALPDVREKSRGVFYRRSNAFVHFHEEDGDVFADLRAAPGWYRYRVTTAAGQRALAADARRVLRGDEVGLRGERF